MSVLDYILTGIEAELALERELGVRSLPCDRSLLVGSLRPATALDAPKPIPQTRSARPVQPPPADHAAPVSTESTVYDFVFLHDRPLSADGVTMMAKIVTAMGKTPKTAPIVITGDLPKARVYIVLGSNALKKWFPGAHAGPGQWISHNLIRDILVTYSPAYILRFGEVLPEVKKIKAEMWHSLKGVRQRL